jgi:hypothetical protein
MSFHRFDSSVAKAPSATDTSLDNQNAPVRRLERLSDMSMGRSSGVFSSVSSEPFATPPFKAGSEAKRFQDETLTSLVF